MRSTVWGLEDSSPLSPSSCCTPRLPWGVLLFLPLQTRAGLAALSTSPPHSLSTVFHLPLRTLLLPVFRIKTEMNDLFFYVFRQRTECSPLRPSKNFGEQLIPRSACRKGCASRWALGKFSSGDGRLRSKNHNTLSS